MKERDLPKGDARSQSRDELEQRRRHVVRLYEAGVPVMQIVAGTGLSWAAVNTAIKLFQADGEVALKPAARGRKQGSGRDLAEEQAAEARRLIRLRRPWFFGLKGYLWSRKTVAELIDRKFGIKLSPRLTNKYLNSWGIRTKEGEEGGPAGCSRDIRNWLTLQYPKVKEQAHKEGAVIYLLNKPLQLDPALWMQTSNKSLTTLEAPEASDQLAREGGQGVAEFDKWEGEHQEDEHLAELPSEALETNVRRKVQAISALSTKGAALWRVTTDSSFGALQQISFMKALINHTPKKRLFIIKHNLNSYNSQQVKFWIKTEGAPITLFPKDDASFDA